MYILLYKVVLSVTFEFAYEILKGHHSLLFRLISIQSSVSCTSVKEAADMVRDEALDGRELL